MLNKFYSIIKNIGDYNDIICDFIVFEGDTIRHIIKEKKYVLNDEELSIINHCFTYYSDIDFNRFLHKIKSEEEQKIRDIKSNKLQCKKDLQKERLLKQYNDFYKE